MRFDATWLLSNLLLLIPLLLSLAVHEWAHAWSAWRLGDDTAQREGRLTLDPFAHMDPVGTFLLPLLGIPFGWAKPVPVNPGRFRPGVSMRTGVVLTAAAGPVSNVVLALLSTLILGLLTALQPQLVTEGSGLRFLLQQTVVINWILAVFNALPIPPLDGSRIADAWMPDALRPAWHQLCSLGPVALVLVLILPQAAGLRLFDWVLELSRLQLTQVVTLFTPRL